MIIVLRKKHIVLCFAIMMLIAIVASLGWDETRSVLSFSALSPIYKGSWKPIPWLHLNAMLSGERNIYRICWIY